MSRKKEWISVIATFIGSMVACLGVRFFSFYVLMSIPLIPRMAVMIISYWLIALPSIIAMIICKDRLKDFGFIKEKLPLQILIGVGIGVVMSLVLTLIPHLAGFGEYVDSGNRYKYAWQFIYEFVYCIIAVGAVEEFVFRGFIYEKFKRISNKEFVALIVSSAMFGFFHIFTGNIIQVFLTGLIGAFFCFCRLKIKNCTTVSLVIAHGVYDALITVWASVFLA